MEAYDGSGSGDLWVTTNVAMPREVREATVVGDPVPGQWERSPLPLRRASRDPAWTLMGRVGLEPTTLGLEVLPEGGGERKGRTEMAVAIVFRAS